MTNTATLSAGKYNTNNGSKISTENYRNHREGETDRQTQADRHSQTDFTKAFHKLTHFFSKLEKDIRQR